MALHGGLTWRAWTSRTQYSLSNLCLPSVSYSPRLPSTSRLVHGSGTRVRNTCHNSSLRNTPLRPQRQYATLPQDGFSKHFEYPPVSSPDDFKVGNVVTVHGFLSGRRKTTNHTFSDITLPKTHSSLTHLLGESIQAVAGNKQKFEAVRVNSPVAITGKVLKEPDTASRQRLEIELQEIHVLNHFPEDIIVSEGVVFPPKARHLQIRFDKKLKDRLLFRAHVNRTIRGLLDSRNFVEYETPQLFKSTPEGAREFLVPTRRPGFAYALPQSPQQYKQLLMASGVDGYYQFARCFRDEDLRADRQPEFTQLDMEMAFATGEDVMQTVEKLVKGLVNGLNEEWEIDTTGTDLSPVRRSPDSKVDSVFWRVDEQPFQRISYDKAMTKYGSDKPDLRIPFTIASMATAELPEPFVSMISDLDQPQVDAIRVRLDCDDIDSVRSFIKTFMEDECPKPLTKNPDGAPAILICDMTKPMQGLSALGHAGYDHITSNNPFTSSPNQASSEEADDLEHGDILIFQARPNLPFSGGSTALGQLRSALYASAVEKGLLPRDNTLRFLWVTDFPMFTDNTAKDADPGQGGSAGFSATHHPFTAPLTQEDHRYLYTDPLKAKAAHYDLVVNGVELGGGSRRIHVARMQEFVLKEVLKMPEARLRQFDHLLEALRAGCPPHAGFALGFDRLVAILSGTNSVRDVIAFPKSMKGVDLMVNAPGKVTEGELATYHLRPVGKKGSVKKEDVRVDGSGELKEASEVIQEKLGTGTEK